MPSAVQVWNPDDWEAISLVLLQHRHGALQVHKIPAAHQGDFGIDYYCTKESVAYQCYAAQEPIDISTRAKRQKKKISDDLSKLIYKEKEVSKLFLGNPVKYWILLAPLHDSKDVNLHCANKTAEIRGKRLAHIAPDFEVGVHDQKSFSTGALTAGLAGLTTVNLSVPAVTSEEMKNWEVGSPDLLTNATCKLTKRTGPAGAKEAVSEAVTAFLEGNAILDALRTSAPDLHENVMTAVNSRSRRLRFAGPQGGTTAGAILNTEIENLISAIKHVAPTLSTNNSEQIAFGVVSDWIMRCPLDFPENV